VKAHLDRNPDFKCDPMSDADFDEGMERLRETAQAGNHRQAVELATRLLAARPEDARPYNGLGIVQTAQGNMVGAVEAFNAAAILNPKLPQPYVNLIFVYARLNMPDAALALARVAGEFKLSEYEKQHFEQYSNVAKQALEQRDRQSEASYNQGKASYAQRRFAEAIPAFLRAVSLSNPSGYFWMGHCYMELGRPLQALRQFEKAILIAPDTHDNYYGKGLCYRNLEQYEKAIEAFETCSRIHNRKFGKDHFESWVGIADCYQRMGDTQKADEARRKAQQLRSGR
jgi:tetratricopeptide (TPR) repeat protein